jgi:hypothetical protein
VPAGAGGSYFRTQKELAGRALVTDTWSKGTPLDATGRDVSAYDETAIANAATVAGMGMAGHQEGYNVLYGDWSAKWYGDPQQRLIWFTHGRNYVTDKTYFDGGPFTLEPGFPIWPPSLRRRAVRL